MMIFRLVMAFLLAGLLTGAAVAQAADAPIDGLTLGRLDVHRPVGEPRGLVFLFSDLDGPDAGTGLAVDRLVDLGLIVAPVALSPCLERQDALGRECLYLVSDIEEASRAERGSGRKDEVVGLSGQEPKSLPKYKGKEYRLQNNGMLFARNGIKGKPKREALVAVKSPNKQLNRNIELQEIALESREKKETETAMKPSKYWEELQNN
mgnify:CR=1 FL=1